MAMTLEALDARGIGDLGGLRENAALTRLFEPHRCRGLGRYAEAPREWTEEAVYQAGSRTRERRVVMVVQEHPAERFRRWFFLVTNLPRATHSCEQILALYRRRGKAEAHMGELKNVVGDSLPCSSRGAASPATVLVRSQALLVYELMHVMRAHMEAVTQH